MLIYVNPDDVGMRFQFYITLKHNLYRFQCIDENDLFPRRKISCNHRIKFICLLYMKKSLGSLYNEKLMENIIESFSSKNVVMVPCIIQVV